MALAARSLEDRFVGCLLGLAVGDALGGRFEAQSREYIAGRIPNVKALINYPRDEIWYTDDTQMTIAVAEALVADGEIVESRLIETFTANYTPTRGYGRGARVVIEAMEEGRDHRRIAAEYFPGGSFGNGAAMRVAPIGLLFRDDAARLKQQARDQSLPTHTHPLGIEGAQLIAAAVAHASRAETFDRSGFFDELLGVCESDDYRRKLEQAALATTPSDLIALGNGIEALESVPTAIACFALAPESYDQTITHAILLGGDTDTIAAMAGAISGAHLGVAALPERLVELLENTPKGRKYLIQLAKELFAVYERRADGR